MQRLLHHLLKEQTELENGWKHLTAEVRTTATPSYDMSVDPVVHTVDSTLAFLYSSAISRDFAHKYTRNRAFLLHAQKGSTRLKQREAVSWDSRRPQDAAKRAQNLQSKKDKEQHSGSRMANIEQTLQSNWALRQTQILAEGMGSIILGRRG